MTIFYKPAQTLRPGARPLPGRYYTSEAIFAEEMEKIFGDRWVFVAHVEQVRQPGDFLVQSVAGESVLVVRDRHDQLHAFYNVCRHRGSRLCTESAGRFSGLIRCPYHAWGFDWAGQLQSAPFMEEVAGFDPADWTLKEGAIALLDGLIFVNLSSSPEPFEQAFAPVMERFAPWQIANLRRGHRIDYHIEANWKLIIQNYSECYHCPGVHPELVKFSAASTATNDFYQGPFLGGPMELDTPYTSLSTSGQRSLPIVGHVSGEDLRRTYYYLLFPNLLLSLQPDYVMVHHVQPINPAQTRVTCDWFFAPNAVQSSTTDSDFDPSPIVDLWDRVNRQDWQVCEGMQAGVSSRSYTPGIYSSRESLLPEIDQEVLRALGHERSRLQP